MTNRVTPGKIILGELGDIESGVRQLIRNRLLEVTEVELPSGHVLRVPTPDERLRIKGFPRPADARTIGQLGRYKGLDARWTDWGNVTDVCRSLAVEMVQ